MKWKRGAGLAALLVLLTAPGCSGDEKLVTVVEEGGSYISYRVVDEQSSPYGPANWEQMLEGYNDLLQARGLEPLTLVEHTSTDEDRQYTAGDDYYNYRDVHLDVWVEDNSVAMSLNRQYLAEAYSDEMAEEYVSCLVEAACPENRDLILETLELAEENKMVMVRCADAQFGRSRSSDYHSVYLLLYDFE